MWNEMTTPSILKEMGARLKEYRLRKGLMQSELAESAGVGVGTIAKMERGGAVSVQILLSVLRSLGLLENLEQFLPYVDNWATCDQLSPRCFKKHTQELLPLIRKWMRSKHTYTKRFGIGTLMRYFLDEAFLPEYLEWVESIKSDEYYIRMMQAWFFATALAKQWDATLPYIEQHRLEKDTHNKTIQKAIESFRITDEQKALLKTLRVK